MLEDVAISPAASDFLSFIFCFSSLLFLFISLNSAFFIWSLSNFRFSSAAKAFSPPLLFIARRPIPLWYIQPDYWGLAYFSWKSSSEMAWNTQECLLPQIYLLLTKINGEEKPNKRCSELKRLIWSHVPKLRSCTINEEDEETHCSICNALVWWL